MCAQPVSRYAVHFSPEHTSALWRFGSALLGYDGATGEEVSQLVPEGLEAPAWRLMTAEPRLHAFHAAIKAPFRLAEGKTEEELIAALKEFSLTRQRFSLSPLQVTAIRDRQGGAFIALTEGRPSTAMQELEHDTVEAMEPFRAPMTDKEFSRRCLEGLSERQLGYLKAYGDPYAFSDFRFYMALTGHIVEEEVEAVLQGVSALYDTHVGVARVPVEALTLYKQCAGANERFYGLIRAPFAASVTE